MNLFTFVFWLLMFYPCYNFSRYCHVKILEASQEKLKFHHDIIKRNKIIFFCIYVIGALLLFFNL